MKKITALIAVFALLASLAACAQPEEPSSVPESVPESSAPDPVDETIAPNAAFESFMAALIDFDVEAMQSLVTENSGKTAIISPDQLIGGFKSDDPFGLKIIRGFTKHISYKRTSAVLVSGGKAEFDVEFTLPDIKNAMPQIVSDAVKSAALSVFSGNPFDAEAFVLDYLENKIDFGAMGTVKNTARVYLLEQPDGSWLIDNDSERNAGLIDALTGGIKDAVSEYESLLSQGLR